MAGASLIIKAWGSKLISLPSWLAGRRYNNFHVALWAAVFASLFVTSLERAEWIGDGHEYLLYARAFAAHASPDLRGADFDHVESILFKTMPDYRERVRALDISNLVDANFASGFFVSDSGEVYSWHFWLYSALVAPLFQIAHSSGVPPIHAFLVFNWAMVAVVCIYACLAWKAAALQKHVLVALFLLGGTTFYVWWPHPEVFTASLVLLALMAASDRRYGIAMFSAALAATQNPPVVVLLLTISIVAFYDQILSRGRGGGSMAGVAPKWALLVKMSMAFALTALPTMFFYSKLGVSNPILAAGWADPDLIGWGRLYSLFFDLNQGAIIALPGVVLGGSLACAIMVVRAGVAGRLEECVGVVVLLASASMCALMAIPALSTLNWNSGQTVCLRYVYWAAIPFVFGFVRCFAWVPKRWCFVLAVISMGIQMLAIGYYGVFGKDERFGFLRFKPFASYVISEFPEMYNPVPEIFIERMISKEISGGVRISPNLSSLENNVFSFGVDGRALKLLMHKSRIDRIGEGHGNDCLTGKGTAVEGGWMYFNQQAAANCESAAADQKIGEIVRSPLDFRK